MNDTTPQGGRNKNHFTGDCFAAALKCLFDAGEAQGHWLVHGLVTRNTCEGTVVHAWVERESDDMVIDRSNGRDCRLPRATYYERYGVRDLVRYSPQEANLKSLQNGHNGPWEPALGKYDKG